MISKREMATKCISMLITLTTTDPHTAVATTFSISNYEGRRDITSFKAYPMRFCKDLAKLKGNIRKQGEYFQEFLMAKHVYYDGWTLTQGPTGEMNMAIPESDSDSDSDSEPEYVTRRRQRKRSKAQTKANKARVHSEHLEGEAVIDFAEGFKAESWLNKPVFAEFSYETLDKWPVYSDKMPIQHWDDRRGSEVLGEIQELYQASEPIGSYMSSRWRRLFQEEYVVS